VENTLGGSIHVNYDLMLRHHGKVHILGEHSFRVRHALLALPGVKKEDVKKAMSHPQALAQTDRYLRGLGITPVAAYDTAGSAKLVREQGLRDTAAVASARAAEVHGLEVLDHGIEDDANNFTRFLILGRSACELPEGVDAKTSLVFVPKRNEVGVLHKALSCFASRDIDLSKIESRPFRPGDIELGGHHEAEALTSPKPSGGLTNMAGSGPAAVKRQRLTPAAEAALPLPVAQFEYAFYVDVLAHASSPTMHNAMRHLEELTRFVKVLGSYPKDKLTLPSGSSGTPASRSASTSALLLQPPLVSPLRIAVLGFGTFGQFLARRWVRRGHLVYAQSRTDYSELARTMGVTYADCAADCTADYSELARTMRTPEELISGLPSSSADCPPHQRIAPLIRYVRTPEELIETVPELDVVVLAVSILSFAKVRHADGATDGASDGASDGH
jgi:prephenate dehydratase